MRLAELPACRADAAVVREKALQRAAYAHDYMTTSGGWLHTFTSRKPHHLSNTIVFHISDHVIGFIGITQRPSNLVLLNQINPSKLVKRVIGILENFRWRPRQSLPRHNELKNSGSQTKTIWIYRRNSSQQVKDLILVRVRLITSRTSRFTPHVDFDFENRHAGHLPPRRKVHLLVVVSPLDLDEDDFRSRFVVFEIRLEEVVGC